MSCRQETCCPPVSTYKSDAGGRATVPGGGGCPVPVVTIFPPDGSFVILPTFVALSCDVEGVAIYYTTDGTEPTEDSDVYSGPFLVSSPYVTVQARAKLTGCDIGPVSAASYPVLVGSSWQFGYLCESGDKVGVFNEFAANGQANDYQFVLLFTLDDDTEILDITILETDSNGFWDSGQSWSTKEYIYPFPDPTIPFHTYPLVLIDQAGPTQLFTSYQTSLGVIAAGEYEWRLWGQPFRALSGFFLCQIALGDGTIIRRLIDTTCTPPPPPCFPPAAPTLVAHCGVAPQPPVIEVSFVADGDWRLYKRSVDCGTGVWAVLAFGPAGPITIEDDTTHPCCTYDYYVEVLCEGTYYASAVASVLAPCNCVINLTSDNTTICAGDSVVIEFEGAQCVGQVSYGTGGQGGSFTGTGALEGSITVSPAETTTYTFKGTSACGDAYFDITITVLHVPVLVSLTVTPTKICPPGDVLVCWNFSGGVTGVTVNGVAQGAVASGCTPLTITSVPQVITVVATNACGSATGTFTVTNDCPPTVCNYPTGLAASYAIEGWASGFFNVTACGMETNAGATVWDGTFPHFSGCVWSVGARQIDAAHHMIASGAVSLAIGLVGVWRLEILAAGSPEFTLWRGEKTTGLTPAGTYTRLDGCATNGSVTLV